jgi:hypothetical protein
MDKLSSDSTVSTSTLCAKDVYSEKDVVFGEVLKDGRRSTEHQIEINGTCVCRSLCTPHVNFNFQTLPHYTCSPFIYVSLNYAFF